MSQIDNCEPIMHALADCLASAFEAVFGVRPGVQWSEITRDCLPSEGVWYRQTFSLCPDSGIFMELSGVPWHIAVLQKESIAGSREGSPEELLFHDLMASLARELGRDSTSAIFCTSTERVGVLPDKTHLLRFRFSFEAFSPVEVPVAIEPALAESLRPLPPLLRGSETPAVPAFERQSRKLADERLSLLADVELQVSASFGGAKIALRDVLKLDIGSIVELDRTVNDPVQVIVNDRVVATGEVVVIDGNYGVRILDVVGARARSQSVGT